MKNRIIISLFLLATFCAAPVFAQEKSGTTNPCEMFNKADFVGDKININVVNTDIREILNYITSEFGCTFVVDKSVERTSITLKADNVSWNVIFRKILESQNLSAQLNGSLIRVATTETLEEESKLSIISCPLEDKSEPLYTVIIKLKNLPYCILKCEQKAIALNRLETTIVRRLTRRGVIKIDKRFQTLIIKDVRSNLESLVSLVELLDNSDFYNQTEEYK